MGHHFTFFFRGGRVPKLARTEISLSLSFWPAAELSGPGTQCVVVVALLVLVFFFRGDLDASSILFFFSPTQPTTGVGWEGMPGRIF